MLKRCIVWGSMLFLLVVMPLSASALNGRVWHVAVSPGIAVLEEDTGFGGSLELLYRLSEAYNVYVGVDAGVYYWETSGLAVAGHLTSIPILATVTYRHEMENQLAFYLGVAGGVALDYGEISVGTPAGAFLREDSEVHAEVVAKPGVELNGVFFEPRVGFLEDVLLWGANIGFRY